MKYDYRGGIERKKSKKWLVVPAVAVVAGVYIYVNTLSPTILAAMQPASQTADKLVSTEPVKGNNRLYIPKINVDVSLASLDQLSKATPTSGQAMSLSAPKLALGLTPFQTAAKSVFHELSQLGKGDDVYVDYNGVRYAYKVDQSGDGSVLNLSDTSGALKVTASSIGQVVWQDGKPHVETL